MESCAPGFDKLELSFFFSPFIEKLKPPVFSTVPASLQAWGHRPRDRNKGGVKREVFFFKSVNKGQYFNIMEWTFPLWVRFLGPIIFLEQIWTEIYLSYQSSHLTTWLKAYWVYNIGLSKINLSSAIAPWSWYLINQ